MAALKKRYEFRNGQPRLRDDAAQSATLQIFVVDRNGDFSTGISPVNETAVAARSARDYKTHTLERADDVLRP